MKNLSKQIKALGATLLLLLGTSCNDNETDIGKVTEPDFQNFFERTQAANLNFYNSLDLSKSVNTKLGKTGFSSLTESLNDQFYASYQSFGLEFDKDLLRPITLDELRNVRTSSDVTDRIREIDNHLGESFYVEMTAINELVFENADHLDQLNVAELVSGVVQNEQLSDDEKAMLTSYLSSLASSFTFLENGGIEQIREALIAENPNNAGRIQRCKVNTRNVLLNAVYTGAANSVRGAIAGGIGGSFTVPILGTATGAVGGAVFGFAAGFVSGVVGGVVVELAATCTRHSTYDDNACERTLALYYAGALQSYPSCHSINDIDFRIPSSSVPRSIGNFFSVNPNLIAQ